MNITDYIPYSNIRATLGVSELELEDTVLAEPIFAHQLEVDLLDISDNVVTVFDAVNLVPELSRTRDERSFYAVFRLYCAYAVSVKLLSSLEMFSFKRVTDGKAEKERFDPSDDVRDGVQQGFIAMTKRLKAALAKLDNSYTEPATTLVVLARGVGLGVNPITTETT